METIEARIQRLEDIEEIRRLKIEYARVVDRYGKPDEFAALFAEDGVMDIGPLGGLIKGRAAIRNIGQVVGKTLTFFLHYMMGRPSTFSRPAPTPRGTGISGSRRPTTGRRSGSPSPTTMSTRRSTGSGGSPSPG